MPPEASSSARPAASYTLIRSGNFTNPTAAWPVASLPLPMPINSNGSDNVPGSGDTNAIIAGQQTWNNINTEFFAFAAPTVGTGTALNATDGKNSIFFDETGINFGAGSTAIAFTALNYSASTGIIEFGPLDGGSIDVIGPDPIAQLDSIEYQLQQFGESLPAPAMTPGDFEPQATTEPEVEIDFRATRDPFAEDFDEEEVVIDRYATLESGNFSRPYVASEEGRQLAALFPTTAPTKPTLSIVREPVETVAP